jgi:hypothetical protein
MTKRGAKRRDCQVSIATCDANGATWLAAYISERPRRKGAAGCLIDAEGCGPVRTDGRGGYLFIRGAPPNDALLRPADGYAGSYTPSLLFSVTCLSTISPAWCRLRLYLQAKLISPYTRPGEFCWRRCTAYHQVRKLCFLFLRFWTTMTTQQ